MAVNTTGNKKLDSLVTGELCLEAFNFACKTLNRNGNFVSKLFMGSIFKEIQTLAKTEFKEVVVFKPKSSRKESKEIYFFCKNLKDLNDVYIGTSNYFINIEVNDEIVSSESFTVLISID